MGFRVNIFAQTDELDVEMIQFVEHFQEMANASRHPIKGSNEHNIEAMPPGIHRNLGNIERAQSTSPHFTLS